jgi:hypothetical protein
MVNVSNPMPQPGVAASWNTTYVASSINTNTIMYMPATNSSWAAVYFGNVGPFSLRMGHPMLKYGDMADYTVSFSYYSAAEGTVTTGTSNPQTTKLVDMGAAVLTLGSAAIATALLAF